MQLMACLKENNILLNAEYSTKDKLLRGIATIAKKNSILNNISEDTLYKALIAREEIGSTGFGSGIAIPHCRLEGLSDFVLGFVTIPEGIKFDAMDEEKVKLFFFIIAPESESNTHIRILSTVSQTLSMPGVIKEIVSAKASEVAREAFLRHTRDEVDTKGAQGKRLFNIYVQNEEYFRGILESIPSIESASFVIIEAQNPSMFLTRTPLFAGLWHDDTADFCKVIRVVVDEKLSNELIRRVESVTGNLTECNDVMLTIQDLFYCSGSLYSA